MTRKSRIGPKVVIDDAHIRILEEFLVSSDEVYTFGADLNNLERAEIHKMCRKMGMTSSSTGKGCQRQLSVYKNKKKKKKKNLLPSQGSVYKRKKKNLLPSQGSVYKRKKKNLLPSQDTTTCLKFSEETKNILRDLFSRFPPNDVELTEKPVWASNGKCASLPRNRDDCFCRPSMSKTEITKKLERLSLKMKENVHLQKVINDRSRLPIWSFKDIITSSVDSHQVVLISGETGCGKTTQVPQYILDHMWDKGQTCKIVCTQPRRISAISVAERISFERGENIGDTVGYKIRMESKGGKQSSIMFCTNGIVLRILIGRGVGLPNTQTTSGSNRDALLDITHIIVDEIHERDRFSDFMLAILRDLLALYPHLRLILMSATMDADRFSQYFNGCPIISVPGFTYPVKSFYLEDVLSILRSKQENHLDITFLNDELTENTELTDEYKAFFDEYIDLALSNDEINPLMELVFADFTPKVFNYQHSSTGVSPLMVFAGKGMVGEVCMLLSSGANCHLNANDGSTALDWAQRESQDEIAKIIKEYVEKSSIKTANEKDLLNQYMASVNTENIDTVLVERLLQKVCSDSDEGAVLIFLPGWDAINQIREKLLASPYFRDSSKFLILPLHSMLPSSEQKKVFIRPPTGARKIILSTNIAETAVTIDDVVYVIDSGRMKEKNYDPYNNVSTLYSSWISKANAKQREGRAGRCQSGICYHLYSKADAASLHPYQVPEIKRMPIEELCLQVKLLDPNYKIADFLQKTLDPPVNHTIHNAILVLQGIGALTHDEKLTELGEKLGVLPVHPSTGKMLFFAILMNCLEPALTLASTLDYKDPFVLPMSPEGKKRAVAAKVDLASLYGGYSDHLATIAAFDYWKLAKEGGKEQQFCSEYFVSSSTMNMISNTRNQLRKDLISHGFISKDSSSCNLNSQHIGILRAILVACTYPMVGRMLPFIKNAKRSVVNTVGGAKVGLHSHSSNFRLAFKKSVGGLLLIYDEITRNEGRMYIKNCSVVGPYPLLLLAMEIGVAPTESNEGQNNEDDDSSERDKEVEMNASISRKQGEDILSSPENNVAVVVDRWLKFKSSALDVAQIYCLRQRLSAAILFKVKHPLKVLPEALAASVHAIACIFSFDWMLGISPPLELVVPVASIMSSSEINESRKDFQSSNEFQESQTMDKKPICRNSLNSVASSSNISKVGNLRSLQSKAPASGDN